MSKNSNITFTRLSVVAKPNEFVVCILQIHWVYLFIHLRADFHPATIPTSFFEVIRRPPHAKVRLGETFFKS